MGPEVVNKNKNCVFNGTYAGRDLHITMYQDTEREFVVTHNADIKPVSYFTGRETEMRDLRHRIEEGRKSVLVSGMGGIGKTHICRMLFEEYINKHAENGNGPFRYIGYIEYTGDMNSSLQNCLRYKEQVNPEQNQAAAWKELEYLASSGKLLLFVDNVDKSISTDPSLQRLNEIPGAVVLTSRRTSFSKEFEPYRIGFLSTEQCKAVYEKIRYEDNDNNKKVPDAEEPDLVYIIEKMAVYHTITIEFLAHLARIKTWTAITMRKKLESRGFCLKYKDNSRFVNIQEEYEKLYDLSELTEAEQNILEAFSVFPYIPLESGICNQWLLADADVSEDDDVLMGLYQKGWLQFDIGQESYSMHPVFAKFIYERCKPKVEKHRGLIKGCQKCLIIPKSGSVMECQKFIPFGENIVGKNDMGCGIEQIRLMYILGDLLRYMGEYARAGEQYKKASLMSEKVLGEGHLFTVACYSNLAWVYEKQGKYKEVEELCKKLLLIDDKLRGGEYPGIAFACYFNFAWVYEKQGKYKEAEELYKVALRTYEEVPGENNTNAAAYYDGLAGLYNEQGKYKEAEELYKKALLIRERVLGEEHPETAISYSSLANVYGEQGRYKEAEELHKKALLIRERVLGEEHLETTNSYNNFACVYAKQGKYKEAEEQYKKALLIRERVLGEEHLETAKSYNNLALVYGKQGKYKEAEELSKKALLVIEKILGEEHSDTAAYYNNLAWVYSEQGKYKEAEELYEKASLIREKVL